MCAQRELPAPMRIIATSARHLRLACEVCGAHTVIERSRLSPGLAPAVLCTTCDAPRIVLDRRFRDLGHAPERRAILPAV
jgi:hypothetical protein